MEELKADGTSCCAKGKCCGCKTLAAVALIAVGAVGGYLGGRHCGVTQAASSVSAAANPSK